MRLIAISMSLRFIVQHKDIESIGWLYAFHAYPTSCVVTSI